MPALSLAQKARDILGHWWVVLVFGTICMVSQGIIGAMVAPIGALQLVSLQVTAATAADYLTTFGQWQEAGLIPFYRAHLIFDGIHWLWYVITLAALLALALKRAGAGERASFLLAIPVLAGMCDLLENTLQQVFLSDAAFATVVDPLPAISTTASIVKWSLVLMSLVLILRFSLARRDSGAA